MVRVYILNTGGTLGMVGDPAAGVSLKPARSAAELMHGIKIPAGVEITTLEDFALRQDSTNVMHADRIQMADQIALAYDTHDAFIVFHGTDSLAETTAVFNLIFRTSLQKPLFVIGAQMTKDESGSDVPMQIENTLRMADAFHRHGVVGVYNVCIGDVWDGSRLRKRAESDVMAFHTPGRPPVAKCWPVINLLGGYRTRSSRLPIPMHLAVFRNGMFASDVVTLKVSADTPPYILMDMVERGRIVGAILEAKGAGNVPDRAWSGSFPYSWIDAVRMATKANIHIGILSPFEDGRVILNRYELGKKVQDAGALSLESLTPDMADAKFRQAIALFGSHAGDIQAFLSTDIVGELLPRMEDVVHTLR